MRNISWQHFDFWLLGAVAVLTIFGIAMIRSTIAGNIELGPANLPMRQLIFAAMGFVMIFIIAAIDYRTWASISGTLYWGAFIMLVALNVVAAAVFGSARWFKTALVNIQPSELVKVIMIIVLAAFFTRNNEKLAKFTWVLRSLAMSMGLVIWVLIQPNMSTSILLMVIWFAMWWASGMRLKHMGYFAIILVIVILAAIPLFPVLRNAKVINDYQLKRINSFIRPDPEARYGDSYNTDQAVIAIGSGGVAGQGYGQATQVQLRFLKVRWSDFIFSSIAAEFGFIGTSIVIALIFFVILRCLRVARRAPDTFGALIAYGVTTLIAFQAMVNMGVNLRVIPATGLPLPFISYGGSSLFSLLLGVGLVESVIVHHKPLDV